MVRGKKHKSAFLCVSFVFGVVSPFGSVCFESEKYEGEGPLKENMQYKSKTYDTRSELTHKINNPAYTVAGIAAVIFFVTIRRLPIILFELYVN